MLVVLASSPGHTHFSIYEGRLSSACTYKNEQQGNNYMLNTECALNRKGLGIKSRAIERVCAFFILNVSRVHCGERHSRTSRLQEHLAS